MTVELEAEAIRKVIFEIIKRFDVDNVAIIEEGLNSGDKISLLYLLNDDPKETLESLKNCLDKPIITEWCRKFGNYGEWKLRMIESLLVMQNYRTLKMLKYNKMDLKEVKILLDRVIRSPVFDIRKALYSTFDNLTVGELHFFINAVENLKQGEIVRRSPQFIEMYLLEWQIDGYFSFEDVSSLNFLLSVLQKLNLNSSHRMLKQFIDNSINEPCLTDNSVAETDQSMMTVDSSQSTPSPAHLNGCYPLFDENNVGICVIVNERKYSRESSCNVRRGSEIDCDRLKETMREMKIKPFLVQDLPSYGIFPSITALVRDNFVRGVHSVLFVVIMAHGDKDFIKGVEGKMVRSNKLSEVLSTKSLSVLDGVPKVIIYQTCRGENHKERNEIETDGCDSDSDSPRIKASMEDFIECFPCLPDFKAYRQPNEGSPYIRVLCRTLLKLYKTSDIQTILIEVNKEFASSAELMFKVNDSFVSMQPVFTVGLLKRLYFYKELVQQ